MVPLEPKWNKFAFKNTSVLGCPWNGRTAFPRKITSAIKSELTKELPHEHTEC
jgi:hypothetical protein